ncbi:MAG: peptidase domain-containing ABC transporter [Gammaproteobacteria bacterium]|nr:peptidase domain-containing ABC transporter [Gammaproteobacteria bacterium]
MRVPVVLQSDQAECGLACLAMVAAFHGHYETLREYRARFHISQRGATLANLRDYAEQLGFQCRAVRANLEELPQLRLPAILHWDLDHFVVLKAAGRNTVQIVDPAVGVRRLSLREASEHFTGVAMELMPTMEFTRRKAEETVPLKSFVPAFRGLGAPLGATFIMTLALQAFALAMPLNTQFTVDQGVRQADMNIVAALAVGFGLVGLVSATTQWLRTLLAQYVGNTLAVRMTTGLAHHLLRLPDTWFVSRHTGDVMSRFASTTPVGNFLMTGAFAILVDAVMAFGALAIMFAYAWDLTLILCAFLAALVAIRFGTIGHLRNLTHETINADAHENSSFIENVERNRAIKLLGAEGSREDAWGERYVRSINANVRLVRFSAHVEFAAAAIGAVQTVAMLMLGAGKVIEGAFTLGMLFAFSSYGGLFSGRAYALIESLVEFRMLRLHRERISDIALEEREIPAAREGSPRTIRGQIEVKSVCFAYGDDGPAVLDDLNLSVAAGEFVGIEGESGAGKSTLIKLLCKLLVPNSGTILIDGLDLRSLDVRHYRRQLGVIMQDDDLFSGSLLENIAVESGDPDMRRVEEATRIAGIHEDISRMPMQYLTLVGHMGSTLSGGQRQRVMIARAIYRQPALILLDEGTAHLNDELQQSVLDGLRRMSATIIAVTHDERVLRRVDRRISLRSAP